MKTNKIMLMALIAILSSALLWAQSPTEKGRFIVDGDFALHDFSSTMDDAVETTSDVLDLNLDLRVGYTVIDNLELNVGVTVEDVDTKNKNPQYSYESKEQGLMFNLGARYYFLAENKLKPFLGLEGGMGTTKVKTTGASEIKYNVSGVGGEVGLAYFMNEHWGIEVLYQYTKINYKENDDHPITEDLDASNSEFSFGFLISF